CCESPSSLVEFANFAYSSPVAVKSERVALAMSKSSFVTRDRFSVPVVTRRSRFWRLVYSSASRASCVTAAPVTTVAMRPFKRSNGLDARSADLPIWSMFRDTTREPSSRIWMLMTSVVIASPDVDDASLSDGADRQEDRSVYEVARSLLRRPVVQVLDIRQRV